MYVFGRDSTLRRIYSYMVLDSNSKKYRFRYYRRVKTSKSYTGQYRAFSIVPAKVPASFTSRERIRFTSRRLLPFFLFFLSNLWDSVVGGFFRCSFRPFRPRTIYITDVGDASALIHYAVRWSEDKTKINIRTYIRRKGKKNKATFREVMNNTRTTGFSR